jgi:hypothetical protein
MYIALKKKILYFLLKCVVAHTVPVQVQVPTTNVMRKKILLAKIALRLRCAITTYAAVKNSIMTPEAEASDPKAK